MTDDVDELMRSEDWQDRCRAAQILARRRQEGDAERLRVLLHDKANKAVVYQAAPALLAVGDGGWQTALESVWWDEDDVVTDAVRDALLQLLLADEDVEARLLDFVDHPRTDSSRRGANEMMIALKMREPADLGPLPEDIP